MNKCIMLGRLCRDVELRTDSDKSIARFVIAVNRRFKNADGEYEADFINCTAFGTTAEFINKYFSKGSMIGVVGRWTTGSYTNKDGDKVYTNDLIVEEAYFAGDKASNKDSTTEHSQKTQEAAEEISDNNEYTPDDDLPF